MKTKQIQFNNREGRSFYATLHKRVNEYFKEHGISKQGTWKMYLKVSFFLLGWIGLYLLILFGSLGVWSALAVAVLLGFFTACVGLNVSHDAIHGSLSANKWTNRLLGYSFNLIGANDHMWHIMHNIVHHTYTNIPGYDEDIEAVPLLLRTSPKQSWRWWHRFQHIYAWILYSFASISWVFVKDFAKFFSKRIGNYDNSSHPTSEYFKLFGFKATYYFLFLVLPIWILPFAWWQVLIGFVVMHLVTGFTLAIVFMLAHVVEGPEFPEPDESGKIKDNWAIHQLKTTANFSRHNPVVNFFFGGLNFQIEHHLFPNICHIHYRPISDIVKKTAEDFDLPYMENTTFWGAIRSHEAFLRRMGKKEVAPSPVAG